MSVSDFAADDLFILRIIKHLGTNPDRKWANSYEFRAVGAGSESDLLVMAQAFVEFEAALHGTAVQFDRFLISTWEADSVPYDPAAFIASTVSAVGTKVMASDIEPLNMVLSVTRVATTGRFGHLFYRGVLQEVEVVSPAGKPTLVNRAAIQTDIDTALGDSSADQYLGPEVGAPFKMVMVNKDGTQVRPVAGLFAQGVSSVPLDHAWFNRAAGGGP